jgi:UDP-N-acetylmuramate dehydrogenase
MNDDALTPLELDRRVDRAMEVLGPLGQLDVPLAGFTTFRIGGPASVFVSATTHDDLVRIAAAARHADLPVVVVGQGSNLLIADEGVAAIVTNLAGDFAEIDIDIERDIHSIDPASGATTVIRAGGAVKLPVLARQSVNAGLTGLEWAVGVPGSVGGGVRMNAGGHGSDMSANLVRAQIFDTISGETMSIDSSELQLGYRTSMVSAHHIVEWAEFALTRRAVSDGDAELRDIVQWRRTNQPGGANCGSVFTNPPGDSAGRLIDAAGLKGFRIGTASVSEKHANFIQADVGARCDDVVEVIEEVRRQVLSRFGIDLHPEVRTLGISDFRRFHSSQP